jgi:hypothetical protein
MMFAGARPAAGNNAALDTRFAYDGAASTHKIEVALDGAEHFVFSGRCASVRRIVALVPMGFCDDPAWDRARARVLDQALRRGLPPS